MQKGGKVHALRSSPPAVAGPVAPADVNLYFAVEIPQRRLCGDVGLSMGAGGPDRWRRCHAAGGARAPICAAAGGLAPQ